MPDKKLTDNEIIKALECCSKPVSENCKECPLCSTDCMEVDIEKLALDLINRLQEKNSNLTSDLTSLQNNLTSLQAENERLKDHIKEGINLAKQLPEMVSLAKAEAYKEFAERLKKEIFFVNIHNCEKAEIKCIDLKPKHIDNLLKELVGEDNE